MLRWRWVVLLSGVTLLALLPSVVAAAPVPSSAVSAPALLHHKAAIGEAFHITSDEVLCWNQIFFEVGKAINLPMDAVHIASDLIAAYDEHAIGSLIGDKVQSGVFDNSKIKRFVPDF